MVLLNLSQIILSASAPVRGHWETDSESFLGKDSQHQGLWRRKWGGRSRGRGRLLCSWTKASRAPTGSSGARRAQSQIEVRSQAFTFPLGLVIYFNDWGSAWGDLGGAALPSWGQCSGKDSLSAQGSLWKCFSPDGRRCRLCSTVSPAV